MKSPRGGGRYTGLQITLGFGLAFTIFLGTGVDMGIMIGDCATGAGSGTGVTTILGFGAGATHAGRHFEKEPAEKFPPFQL